MHLFQCILTIAATTNQLVDLAIKEKLIANHTDNNLIV